MRILITNDDGINAPGIKALVEVASKYGEVKVFAPDRERSGSSRAITLYKCLRARKVENRFTNAEAYEVNGTPADCVVVGLNVGWPDGCDLLLSGFNNGPNIGFHITSSGTVGAAIEATLSHIKSVALSMGVFASSAPAHFETGKKWLDDNWDKIMNTKFPEQTLLNVNIPAISSEEILGTKITQSGKRVYANKMLERLDPWNEPYYWYGSVVEMDPHEEGTDIDTISKGYVSVTPIQIGVMDDGMFEDFKHLE